MVTPLSLPHLEALDLADPQSMDRSHIDIKHQEIPSNVHLKGQIERITDSRGKGVVYFMK